MRAQGKPDAGRIRWPCVQGRVEKAHKHFSHHRTCRTSGFPSTTNIAAYAGRYSGVIPFPRCRANVLRLAVRLGGFAFATTWRLRRELDLVLPSPSAAAIVHAWRRSLHEIGRPAHTIVHAYPLQSASVAFRPAQATMADAPRGPERFGITLVSLMRQV